MPRGVRSTAGARLRCFQVDTTRVQAGFAYRYSSVMCPRVNTEDLIDAAEVSRILGLSHRNAVNTYLATLSGYASARN